MSDKMFPIQSNSRDSRPHPLKIPWPVAELAYSTYARRHGRNQSLEQLAERGGFCSLEMDDFLPDWRERCDELSRLRASLASAESRLAIVVEALEAWVQYDDADPQVKGECLREARERTALSQVRSKP